MSAWRSSLRPTRRYVPFSSGSGFTEQEHACFGRGDPRDQLQHVLECGRAADQALLGGASTCHPQVLHLLDEVGRFAARIAHRNELDVDVSLALRWRCSTRSRRPDCRGCASGKLSPAWSQGTLKWWDTS
jgi:hypothetical protein